MNEPTSDDVGAQTRSGSDSPPPGRYDDVKPVGSTLTGRIVAVVLVVLAVGLVLGGAYTVFQVANSPSIDGQAIGVQVVDDNRTEITISVTRDEPGTAVFCILRALDYSKGEVGRSEVFVPPSDQSTVRASATLATDERAYTAEVYGCGDDVPDYLRP